MRSIVVKAEDLHLYSSRVWHVMLFVKHPELFGSLSSRKKMGPEGIHSETKKKSYFIFSDQMA